MTTHAVHWDPAVVALVERERRRALEEAAAAIENGYVRRGHNVSVICRCLRCEVALESAAIVRTHADP